MTTLLSRYLFKRILFVTLLTCFIITALLFFLQASKYLDLVISKGVNGFKLVYISLLAMPSFWNELLPIAIFISIIITWQILINHNEIIIIRAAGVSSWQIVRPTIVIGLIGALTCLILSLFVINTSYLKFLQVRDNIKNNLNLNVVGSNKFMQLTPEITIYVEKVDKTNLLHNVLIYSKVTHNEYTIYAETARVTYENGEPKILLNEGSIQRLNNADKTISVVDFDYYILTIPTPQANPSRYARTSAKKMYLWELFTFNNLHFIQELKRHNYTQYRRELNNVIAEINKRCVNIILCISLVCVAAYFFTQSTFNRRAPYLASFKSLVLGLSIKVLTTSVIINTTNVGIIVTMYILLLAIIGYSLLVIRKS